MPVTDSADLVQMPGGSVQVRHHHDTNAGIQLKRLFQCRRIHVPALPFGINENGDASLIHNGIRSRRKRHVRAEYPLARTHTRQFDRQMQRRRSGGKRHPVADSDACGEVLLNCVDVRAHRRHPVGVICLPDIAHFLPVHGRGGKPDFLLKRLRLLRFPRFAHNTGTRSGSPSGHPFRFVLYLLIFCRRTQQQGAAARVISAARRSTVRSFSWSMTSLSVRRATPMFGFRVRILWQSLPIRSIRSFRNNVFICRLQVS